MAFISVVKELFLPNDALGDTRIETEPKQIITVSSGRVVYSSFLKNIEGKVIFIAGI